MKNKLALALLSFVVYTQYVETVVAAAKSDEIFLLSKMKTLLQEEKYQEIVFLNRDFAKNKDKAMPLRNMAKTLSDFCVEIMPNIQEAKDPFKEVKNILDANPVTESEKSDQETALYTVIDIVGQHITNLFNKGNIENVKKWLRIEKKLSKKADMAYENFSNHVKTLHTIGEKLPFEYMDLIDKIFDISNIFIKEAYNKILYCYSSIKNFFDKFTMKEQQKPIFCLMPNKVADKNQVLDIQMKTSKVSVADKPKTIKLDRKMKASEVSQANKSKIIKYESVILEEVAVPGDGDCGYHALGISRKKAADLLIKNIGNAKIRELIAPEIEDHFFMLPKQMSSRNEYKSLINRLEKADGNFRESICSAKKMLLSLRHNVSSLTPDELIKYMECLEVAENDKDFYPIFLKLIADSQELKIAFSAKSDYCKQLHVVEQYIKSFIAPSTVEFDKQNPWQELNYLNFSSYNGRSSTGDAIANLLGKNLIVVSPYGKALHKFITDAKLETIYLIQNSTVHYNRGIALDG